jgi:acetolactate synthase-1/2/3 large subunit
MRVADFVFNYLSSRGVRHVFFLPGGGAMHLNNALLHEPSLTPVSMLHEQGASIAAEGYARTSGGFGVCLVTSGPGVTNALTGLAGAWFESTPVVFISGQVKRADLKGNRGLRQLGPQELDVVPVVDSLTKYVARIVDPLDIRFELEKAMWLMLHRRPGPVWIDIPLDVQAAEVDPTSLRSFVVPEGGDWSPSAEQVSTVLGLISQSKRPVVLAGHGVHIARAESQLRRFVETFEVPALTTWTAADLLEHDHPLYFGRPGTVASRGANFTIQNSDFVLVIGSRLDFSITGFDRSQFARAATIVIVDIDHAEIEKLGDLPDFAVCCDAKSFLELMLAQHVASAGREGKEEWLRACQLWKGKYPVLGPECSGEDNVVNSYRFTEVLCQEMSEGDLLVPGSSGAAIDTFWLSAKLKYGQKAVATGGLGSMGYGLPASIGGCLGAGARRTISVDGDGGFIMNIQELEVVKRLNLPIKYFVINNNGYASIRASQTAYFKRTLGCDPASGMTLPDLLDVARAFGLPAVRISKQSELVPAIRDVLSSDGPVVCEVIVQPDQPIGPRVSSRVNADGTMVSTPLEDLHPFLDREELKSNMMIPLVEVSK